MEQIAAAVIFALALALILGDWLQRTIAAIGGAVVMVVAGRLLGFYDEVTAFEAVDFTTIGLLLGMMIVVALLEPTGFFEYVALWAGRLSRGRPLRLFLLLGVVTSVLSMFLDNVTTVVAIAPVTLVIARVLRVEPAPLLIAQAMLANVAGAATLIGDPPNILIASAADLSFNDFLTHSLPVIVVTWGAVAAVLWLMFRRELGGRGDEAADARAQPEEIRPSEALKDPGAAWRVLAVLGGAIVLFFLQEALHVSPAFVAMGAAAAALLLVRPDVAQMLARVEWSVLLFFSALFAMVGGLEHSGALNTVAEALGGLDALPPMLLGVLLIWMIAILSAVVDNIPITITLIPVIGGLAASGIDIGPLWWALAFGAGLGGNATVIGSTANVIVVSISERGERPIRSSQWMRRGIPVMLVSCAVTSVMYVVLYPLISR